MWRFRIRVFNIQLSLKIPYLPKLILYHDIHTWCLFSLYSAKSTELLHSPPVYESDIDTRDHDFYDYAEHPGVQDDDFYYVSWEDPIYDVFEDYDYSGMYSLGFHSRTRFYFMLCCFFLVLGDTIFSILR